jgi:hypothetical protein
LFKRFSQLSAGASSGPGSSLGWAVQYLLIALLGPLPKGDLIAKTLSRLLFFWCKWFDYLIPQHKWYKMGACGTYFIGTKEGKEVISPRVIIGYFGKS